MTLFPSSGVASNGKQIFSWSQAAAQLTRTGNTWSAISGAPATVTYAFRSTAPSTMPDGVSGFQQFNSAQIIAAEAALQLWSDVANISFARVGSGGSGPAAYSNNASILFASYTTETDPASAFAYLPYPGGTGPANFAGDVWVDVSETENANPVFGEWGPHVLAHEIGHAIGINHPGDYDGGSPTYAADAEYWQDARMFTIMSYFGSTNAGGVLASFSWGPQYHDIAAAQLLYGANMSTRTGDTIYGFNSTAGRTLFEISSAAQGVVFSIWDAGGNDTLDLSGYSQHADIDLRPGAFSSAGPTDTGPAQFNISIAVGALIENGIGGSGNDTLTGNDAQNILEGRNGNDSLIGGIADDTLIGGVGADKLDGGADIDTASYADATGGVTIRLYNGTGVNDIAQGDVLTGIENLIGSNFGDALIGSNTEGNRLEGGGGNDYFDGLGGNDTLIGGAGADLMKGGAGNDLLQGGASNDNMDGGAGIDTASYADATGGVTIRLYNGTGVNDIAQGDVLTGIENLIGSNFGDALIGSNTEGNRLDGGAGNDYFDGLGGDDTLIGGDGNDLMKGGAGNDRIVGDAGNDLFYGGAGADTLDGGADIDTASYSDATGGVAIRLYNGTGVNDIAQGDVLTGIENLTGSNFGDALIGSNTEGNRLDGGAGNDYFDGLGGDDTLIGGAGNDLMKGGTGSDVFEFSVGFGADRILDFAGGAGAEDVIRLIGFGAAFDTFQKVIDASSQVGADTVINLNGATITLAGVMLTNLDADDFLFG